MNNIISPVLICDQHSVTCTWRLFLHFFFTVYRLPAGAIVCLIFVYIVKCGGNGMCVQFQYLFVHWPCMTGRMCSSLHYIAEHFTRKVEYVI